ncbi:uncharacterized protein MONOS_13993 [Monocercomonoides exilis]|uniref:uncharacterized protein n=2 Tax=Monocercomonoides exilis TaxID=2049356 RepID=UPI0035594BE1|nr:hypothetical protein MONOS_13993 [Monocercomonoides exilis]|eukprot:MONOS_13993.1-p1 / transcript=MONOS_13993.1 / gene=MONOS_13993 / organism=Monocercomonoides_exilis_PA203 / gene_product=unspecified product / transcript_product=unspecified product / location=Mono_scaffold00918:15072-17084(-) / protein_length=542 / sequence_SO=supercontig / SO=protein_coding / is_pseudo=false
MIFGTKGKRYFSYGTNDACSPSTTTSSQTSCFMNSCSFSSVCDAYDGGIVPSLNNPSSSLTVSNASFIGCCRTRNVVCEGNADGKLTPGRQNETFNGANSFIWCEWNGSRTTGTENKWEDGVSSGGAICMYSQSNAIISIKHCSFNDCYAYCDGGGVMCAYIESVEIVNNTFNSCTAQTWAGGGMCIYVISSCVQISGCEFQNCKANRYGGGLDLDNFNVSGSGCIPTENGEGGSACVFDCCFTSCSVTNYYGGGMYCANIPITQFKMRSIQFISCSASAYGGGLDLYPYRQASQNDVIYCYFLFFHECKCSADTPYGHDAYYVDYYNVFLNSDNPFYECYTTNTNEQRVCYAYNYAIAKDWSYNQTSKKVWLNEWSKVLYVGANGSDSSGLCGMGESAPCQTVGHAVETGLEELSSSVTLMEGNHVSETATIDIGSKKISVIGKGRTESSIGTGALSSAGALFSVSTGHLGLLHMKVDCNSSASPSPSVVVVSDGSGSLSLEDVVIATSKTGNYVMSSSVFVVPLSQLSMVDVVIKDMKS